MSCSNLLASKLATTPSTTPPLGQTIHIMMANSPAASSASASSAALATAVPTSAVSVKEQRAFLNQILYLKKTGNQPDEIQAIHDEYLASQLDAKKAMVAKWLGSGKNVSVLVKEEHNTRQKLEEAGRVGYLKPGQVAEKMGIKVEYFQNSKEFKAGP